MATNDISTLTHADVEEMLLAVNGKIIGLDTNDNEYDSILSLWNSELKPVSKAKEVKSHAEQRATESEWYNKAFDYWESDTNCPITDDGVLGGYGSVTPMDTRDSNVFLDKLLAMRQGFKLERVADCGAGIGRVAKNLLLPRCQYVDLVEQSPRLLAAAPAYLSNVSITGFLGGIAANGSAAASTSSGADGVMECASVFHRIGSEYAQALSSRVRLLNIGLQDFAPEANTYDLIWIQWVIGHLHDLDCIRFFRRCAAGLTPRGLIVLKDNVLLQSEPTFLWDLADSSVARQRKYLKLLLSLAGLQVVLEMQQTNFPEELFPVMMWAISSAPLRIPA